MGEAKVQGNTSTSSQDIFGKQGEANLLASTPPAEPLPKDEAKNITEPPDTRSKVPTSCPHCYSKKLWKDGLRKSVARSVQRYVCRVCGYRFSEQSGAKSLFSPSSLDSISQIGATPIAHGQLVRNLAAIEPLKEGPAGATTENQTLKGKIVEYEFWMLKRGYAKSTIECRTKVMKRLLKLGANIFDPESVKETIAAQAWSEGRKEYVAEAYTNFLIMAGGKWDQPRYKRIEKIPFIPTEQEVDQLIAGCGEKTSTLLQMLKETAMRVGEAWNLKWTDIDFVNNTVSITPEKGSHARMLKLSSKALGMISMLPKKSEKIFGTYELRGYRSAFVRQRKRTAHKLQNPRITKITFHTFRHWKATMEYHRTKDILHVMRLLGHKNIKNTLIYTQLVTFEDDDYLCKAATNVKEATELIESGYEYVCEMEHLKLFRKRK